MQAVDIDQADRQFHRRHKNAILLVTLLLLILMAPINELFKDRLLIDMALATIVIAASLNAISQRKRSTVIIAIGLSTLAITSGWSQTFHFSEINQIIYHSLVASLYIYISALLFKVILIEDKITFDQIFAAVAIYIFIGITWAHFYVIVGVFDKESIDGITATINGNESDYLYFSFVTLTTLGYGDILPVNSMTKALVIIEAISGVMFVAILISTLVGRVNMRR
jgi:voltage-gated potassium channel